MAILSITLLGLAAGLAQGTALATDLKEKSAAVAAVQEEVELIRDMSFDQIQALGSTFSTPAMTSLNGATGQLAVDPSVGPDLSRITVTVNWSSRQGRPLSRRLVTLVSRSGINKQ